MDSSLRWKDGALLLWDKGWGCPFGCDSGDFALLGIEGEEVGVDGRFNCV